MLELALRVPSEASEDVLDRLLPIAPHGVHEVPAGDEMELRVRGAHAEMPTQAAVAATAGEWTFSLREREVPDDWAERRLLDYEPQVIGGRLVVRPGWAPPAPDGLLDVVIEDQHAFGGGAHPTTWTCLEELCELEPQGSFADLGCGTGVLAIAAARLGFEHVVAVDREPAALAAVRANAARNAVALDVNDGDLLSGSPPAARTVIANVPPEVHAAIAGRLDDATETVIASGVLAPAAGEVANGYAAAGFGEAHRREAGGWAVLTLRRVSA